MNFKFIKQMGTYYPKEINVFENNNFIFIDKQKWIII